MCKRRCFGVLLSLVVLSPACDRSGEPRTVSAAPARNGLDQPRPRQRLISNYRAAHRQGDLERFLKLVYLEGAEPNAVDSFISSFEGDRKMTLAGVSIEPLNPDDVLEYERDGVRYVPNLTPVGWLKISFSLSRGGAMTTSHTQYLIGYENEEYRIVTSRPVTSARGS